jgi:hypothetical protein
MGRRHLLPVLLLLALACGGGAHSPPLTRHSFPKGFVFGTDSAAYQVRAFIISNASSIEYFFVVPFLNRS